MKKFLALVLAVICIFSMATVAFAADENLGYGWTCEFCGGYTADYDALIAHQKAFDCGKCDLCGKGFETSDKLKEHKYECNQANVVCDYCGETNPSQAKHDAHIEACKAKYFNIPLAKIIATVKDLLAKIDFSAVFATVKDLGGKLVGALGNIGK